MTPDLSHLHPSTRDALRCFAFSHLEGPARLVARHFAYLAFTLVGPELGLTRGAAELTKSLNALTTARDAAIRCAVGLPSAEEVGVVLLADLEED